MDRARPHRRRTTLLPTSSGPFAPKDDPDWVEYLERIADVAGRADATTVLVAVADGRVLGTATVEVVEPLIAFVTFS